VDLTERLAGTDAGRSLDDAHDAAFDAVDADLLGLLRDRIAMLLGHHPTLSSMADDRRTSLAASHADDAMTDLERAALDFTEQYIIDVTNVSDAQVNRLRQHLTDAQVSDLVNAVLVIEQRMTLELTLDTVLEPS
jgi:hypothetical protein